ncbi:hypothetical protein [Microbacterium trichothecenolyticum]|uniref:Multidrug resistance efflux pump n=1 Tax=Microbacterium trichothecenolyticum TaxID=69370 RepID=A0ABU0TT71_MICTR|nr:hypothetical protein [Microbacterium trichothecenolyticum]MDQ1122855.1 multidrug resistance efflux pump [Microbacterium trichothecenolyticum]
MSASAAPERQRACIRAAQARLAAFLASTAVDIDAAARDAEDALRSAVSSGAGLERVSAELELSPRALRAIVDGTVRLRSLHPDDRLRPA